jgi:hypothetical protein
MDLYWVPLGKPKPGFEEQHAQLFQAMQHAIFFDVPAPRLSLRLKEYLEVLLGRRKPADLSRARLANGPAIHKQLNDISISPLETLGCPRVGIDASADSWLEQAFETRVERREGMTFEEFKHDLHGEYVLALAPPSEGLPSYVGAPRFFMEDCCFLGKFLTLDGIEEILGPDVHIQAWSHFMPQDLLDFAEQLEDAAQRHATEQGITRDVLALQAGEEFSHEEEQLMVLLAAARWCRFWGEDGHPVWSDYFFTFTKADALLPVSLLGKALR